MSAAASDRPSPAGYIVGLAIEARLLAKQSPDIEARIACAAADAARARDGARRLLAEGARALVSFGIAGGLDPALRPGDLVLAEQIHSAEGETFACDPDLHARWEAEARAAGLRHSGGILLGSARPITSVAEKWDLHESSGAVAVDMESAAVARVAAGAGIPVLAVRAIADPAERTLPATAVGSIGPDGEPRLGSVLLGLCRRPWEIPALLQLRRDRDAALATLGRLVGGFGPAGLP